MKQVLNPINLELLFDRSEVHLLERVLIPAISLEKLSIGEKLRIAILNAVNFGEHFKVLELCEQLFTKAIIYDEQVYSLQWAVAATEMVYDLKLRTLWLKRWSLVSGWHKDFWSQYVFHYQQAMTYFFAGTLRESERLFKTCLDIALNNNYARGVYRSYFHLALIERDSLNYIKANEYLERALLIAEQNKSVRFIERIKTEIDELNVKPSYDKNTVKVFQLIKNGMINDARAFIRKRLSLCKLEGVSTARNSEYLLLALYLYSRNKTKSFTIVLTRIEDPIIRYRLFAICSEFSELSANYKYEFEFLGQHINIRLGNQNTVSAFDMLSLDCQKLLKLLTNHSKGLSKEELAHILWRQGYNPLYHDAKIYKLVLKCRRESNNPRIIINNYGIYRLGEIQALNDLSFLKYRP